MLVVGVGVGMGGCGCGRRLGIGWARMPLQTNCQDCSLGQRLKSLGIACRGRNATADKPPSWPQPCQAKARSGLTRDCQARPNQACPNMTRQDGAKSGWLRQTKPGLVLGNANKHEKHYTFKARRRISFCKLMLPNLCLVNEDNACMHKVCKSVRC